MPHAEWDCRALALGRTLVEVRGRLVPVSLEVNDVGGFGPTLAIWSVAGESSTFSPRAARSRGFPAEKTLDGRLQPRRSSRISPFALWSSSSSSWSMKYSCG